MTASAIVALPLAMTSPKPGTAKQVAALVAAAPRITKLPRGVQPRLSNAPSDQPATYWPSLDPCVSNQASLPACVFGDVHGKETMVAFGDSHTYMWFGALDKIAKAAKWRLVALLDLGCPVADTTVWDAFTGSPNTGCPIWRSAMIQRIDALDPKLIVMSESFYPLNGDDQTITDAAWTTDLESTFAQLDSPHTAKVLIGDTVLIPNPIPCLAANTSDVQHCSVVSTSPAWKNQWAQWAGQRAADQSAAAHSGVTYVNELPWECSATCSVVIGKFIAYDSSGHLSNTYALYLSGVLAAALAPLM